jgi:hypothetical protein
MFASFVNIDEKAIALHISALVRRKANDAAVAACVDYGEYCLTRDNTYEAWTAMSGALLSCASNVSLESMVNALKRTDLWPRLEERCRIDRGR